MTTPKSIMTESKPSRVVLITGSAKRLGREIALTFARAGWDVAIHYNTSHNEARRTADEITTLGVRCTAAHGDLADPEAVATIFDHGVNELGQIDVVVNNASLFEYDEPATFSNASLQAHIMPNLAAPLLLAQKLASHLTHRGKQASGAVINLLDQKLWGYNPDFFSYTLSKAALHAATTMMAQAYAPQVRVVGVAPGLTLPSHMQTPADFERTHALSPLGKASSPQDIARTILFVAETPSITGTSIVVDGGQHLMGLQRDFSCL
ncbi:MAG: SDR family oxidoreductase [Pusillimonas sp.]